MPVANDSTTASHDCQSHPELGPLIAEQKATHAIAWLYTGLGGIMLLFGILLFGLSQPGQKNFGFLELVLGVLYELCALGVLVLGIAKRWRDRGFALYLHDAGIRERRAAGDSMILFRDANELKFQSTRIFVNGVYAGTVEHLAVTTDGPEPRSLYFQRKIQEPGQGMGAVVASQVDQIGMHIAKTIAEKMAVRLDQQEMLPWTRRMRISLKGLEIEPRRWWESDLRDLARSIGGWFRWGDDSRGKWPHFDWIEIDGMRVESGVFRVWVRGEPRPRLEILTGVENFHPGYIVASGLWSQARTDTP